MRKFLVRAGKNAPLHLYDGRRLTFKLLDEIMRRDLWFNDVSAGENVHRSVTVFGPCVYGEMGFGDYNHAADTERVKLVEGNIDYGGFGLLCCGNQRLFYFT